MGGKPSKGTPKDGRLKANKTAAKLPAQMTARTMKTASGMTAPKKGRSK